MGPIEQNRLQGQIQKTEIETTQVQGATVKASKLLDKHRITIEHVPASGSRVKNTSQLKKTEQKVLSAEQQSLQKQAADAASGAHFGSHTVKKR